MAAFDFNGAAIWSIAIIAGPILLGLALAYAMLLRRRRNTPDRNAPEYRDDKRSR